MPREAGERMREELTALQRDVRQLREQQDLAQARQAETRARDEASLQALRGSMEQYSQSARRADAEMGSQIEQMLGDVQQLRGAIEVNEHRLSETEARLQQELATRLSALRRASRKEERDSASQSAKSAAPRKKGELLAYAQTLWRSGQKADARGVWRDIVRRYGKERGLADEALFALGNTSFEEGRFDAALRDFVRLVDGFAKSPRLAEAYYKIGAASEGLGRLDDARTFYAEVQTNHGGTPWAGKARARLAALAQPPAGAPKAPAATPALDEADATPAPTP